MAAAPYDDSNIFAKILRGEIPCTKIAENASALAFQDINPQAPQHALVIPKKPYVSFADFSAGATAEEIADWARLIGEVARALGVEDSGYRLLVNSGADSLQEVPHLHAHIVGGRKLGALLAGSGA